MNEEVRQDIITTLNIGNLPRNEQDGILAQLALTIQKEFLHDVATTLGEEKWKALTSSLALGETFYTTTLTHLLPNYENVFAKTREKVLAAFKN